MILVFLATIPSVVKTMLHLQPASQEIFEKKFQLKDMAGKPVEMYEQSFERVARALANVEEKNQEYWYDQFLWALKNGAIPAGRIFSNAGAEKYKPNVSLINCVVSGNIHDSIEDILQKVKESGMSLSKGCGIGYCFSSLRPAGSFINGVGATTSGTLSFMNIYDSMCFTIASAGGRRGAQMGTLHDWHPDILKYITVKREDGRFRQFNLSVLVSDALIKAVMEDKDWNLYFPVHVKEYEEYPNGNYVSVKNFPFQYDEYVRDQDNNVICKIYSTIKATELWNMIMRSTYDFAEPGVLFIDRINQLNPLNFEETIVATNPCVTGDTLILTDKGHIQIQDLVDQTIKVWNGKEFSLVTPKVTGKNKEVLNFTFSDGSNVKVTDYHNFPIWEGFSRDGQVALKQAKDVKIGDKLEKWDFPVIALGIEVDRTLAYTKGFFCGDGSIESNRNRQSIWLYGKKQQLLDYLFYEKVNVCEGDRSFVLLSKDVEWDKSFVPTVAWNIYARLDWLAGLLDSDGSIQNGAVSIWSVDKQFLMNIKSMLSTLGVFCTINIGKQEGYKDMPGGNYFCKTSYRLTISSFYTQKLINFGLTTNRLKLKSSPNREASRFICVTNIEKAGVEEKVYCFTESKRNRGTFNNIVLSQCGEQPLPPYGSCLLGSINLTNFVEKVFTTGCYFDWDRYRKVIEIFSRMLDNTVELNGLALKEQRHEIFYKRRHGMGYTGLGSTLAMLGITYGSQKAITFTKQVTELISTIGFLTGVKLATEKGPAPIFEDKEKLRKYLSSPFIQQVMNALEDGNEDFAVDLTNHGIRYTHFGSIAPTGTISFALGNNCSNGIEPSFDLSYKRNVIKEGKKTKEQMDVYSYEALLWKAMKGNENYPESFITAKDVSPYQHIDMQAAAQKWIDSSISKTINVATDFPFEDFKNLYIYAYKAGLKGCTTYRFNPEAFSGVLVRKEDLENTTYIFNLEDGSSISLNGAEEVLYDGEKHIVSNLFDAIKEGYYGKF